MEHRARQHHVERLGEALREEIAALIEGELGDPRIGLATVTEVQMAPDGRAAHVLVAVVGDEHEAERTLQGLTAARNFVRREVGERLQLRHPPELYFRLDRSQEYESRIDELLQRLKKRNE
jgi:ribosome-binding factor A